MEFCGTCFPPDIAPEFLQSGGISSIDAVLLATEMDFVELFQTIIIFQQFMHEILEISNT